MADIQLSQKAEQDIKDIYFYTAHMFGQRQADAYVTDLLSAAKSAASFPLIGRNYTTRSGRSYRRYECGRHTLFYRIVDSGIFIVRILHVRMDAARHI